MENITTRAERYRIGDLILDTGTFQVTRAGTMLDVPRLSFQLLLALVKASPNVLSQDDLVKHVWTGRFVSHETVTQRVKLLRQALDDSAAEPRYIGLVRGEGYRLVATVERLSPTVAASPSPVDHSIRTRLRLGLVAFSFILATLAVVYYFPSNRDISTRGTSNSTTQNLVAVLPFANVSENPADTYISEGLGDELRDQLGRISGLRIAARTSSIAFRDDPVDAVEIASRLGVDTLVEGIFHREDDQLNVTVRVVNGKTGLHDWTKTYTLHIRDVLEVQQQMAEELARQLLPIENGETVVSEPVTRNLSAHDLILLARHYEQQVRNQPIVDQALLLKAIDMYRMAVKVDPMSALAHSRLGGALLYLGDVEGAKAPIFESLKLNSEESDVQYTLGLYYWKRGLPGSGAAYERAIQLNPNNADALSAYAMWRWHQGDANSPEQFFQRALALDPMLPSRYLELGSFYGNAGRSVEAMGMINELNNRFGANDTALMQARIYELIGDYSAAITWALRACELQPDNPEPRWMAAELYARIGDFQHAGEFEQLPGLGQLFWQRRYDELIDLAEDSLLENPGEIKTAYVLARAYDATGRFEQAIALLQRAGLPAKVYSDSRRADGVEILAVLADAHDALGEVDKAMEYSNWLIKFLQNMTDSGFRQSWWPDLYQACALSITGRNDEALERLSESIRKPGLPWYPFLVDSHCFRRYADDPRYQAVIGDLDRRMAGLRQGLSVKLAAPGTVKKNVTRQP